MRLVIRGSSFAMSFGSANLSFPPLQTAIGVLIFSILYTGGVDCKKGRRPEWMLLYQKLCLEKGSCASISLSLVRSLQWNSKDEGHPLSVYCSSPVPCLLWRGMIHPIPVSFGNAWLRVVLQIDTCLCPWEVEIRKEQCLCLSGKDCRVVVHVCPIFGLCRVLFMLLWGVEWKTFSCIVPDFT